MNVSFLHFGYSRVNFTEKLKNKKSTPKPQILDINATVETCKIDDDMIEKLKKCRDFSVKLNRVKSGGLQSKKGDQCDKKHNISASTTSQEKTVQPRRSKRGKKISEINVKCANPVEKERNKIDIITPIQMANIIWISLTSQGFNAEIGSVVCAKMATFWPWPAQIIKYQKDKCRVKFFGDLKEGTVKRLQCVPFHQCHTVIFHYLKSIDDKMKCSWIINLEQTLDPSERNIRNMPMRQLYLQAIRDVELYLDRATKLLNL